MPEIASSNARGDAEIKSRSNLFMHLVWKRIASLSSLRHSPSNRIIIVTGDILFGFARFYRLSYNVINLITLSITCAIFIQYLMFQFSYARTLQCGKAVSLIKNTYLLTHLLTYLLSYSLTYLLTYLLSYLLTNGLIRPLMQLRLHTIILVRAQLTDTSVVDFVFVTSRSLGVTFVYSFYIGVLYWLVHRPTIDHAPLFQSLVNFQYSNSFIHIEHL